MIQKDLIKKLQAYRGQVMVEIHNFNDVVWVQAVKSDLIHMLKMSFHANQETGFELDDNGTFGKDFINGN